MGKDKNENKEKPNKKKNEKVLVKIVKRKQRRSLVHLS